MQKAIGKIGMINYIPEPVKNSGWYQRHDYESFEIKQNHGLWYTKTRQKSLWVLTETMETNNIETT